MKILVTFLCSWVLLSSHLCAVTYDELMHIHKVTTSEMNGISSPAAGSLVYNTTEDTLFFYTGITWKKMRSSGSETSINAGNGVTLSGTGTSATPYVIGL